MHFQHHRGFHVTGMNAVLGVVVAVDAFRHSETEPVNAHHHHIVADAKLSRHDIHDTDLAAMAVEKRHFADAACCHAATDFAPHANDRLCRECQRAGIKTVLVALADGLRRQEKRVACFGQAGDCFLHHAVDNSSIDCQRQVRSVLFDCTDGQNRHELLAIEAGECLARIIGPISFQDCNSYTLGPRALNISY